MNDGVKLNLFCEDGETMLSPITRREWQICQLVGRGWDSVQVARHLGIQPETVRNHLQSVFDVLGVHSRLQMALYLIHYGLLDDHRSYQSVVEQMQAEWRSTDSLAG